MTPTRIVHCEDAIAWLQKNDSLPGCSLAASLPDISEFSGISCAEWKEWFTSAAVLILSRTPEHGVTIFFQSDIKLNGEWIDKAYLCQKSAELVGTKLLWHKIVGRAPAGQATFGRPGYSHILCFSQSVTIDIGKSTADIIPLVGDKTWPRGMGTKVTEMIAKFIVENTDSHTLVNPFCGQGSLLAAANHAGLNAIGIERSPKRAEIARNLRIIQSADCHYSNNQQ